MRRSCVRAQIMTDALAITPPTLGLVYFAISRIIDFLIETSSLSFAIMIFIFPRYETLEAAVIAKMTQAATLRAVNEESYTDV